MSCDCMTVAVTTYDPKFNNKKINEKKAKMRNKLKKTKFTIFNSNKTDLSRNNNIQIFKNCGRKV